MKITKTTASASIEGMKLQSLGDEAVFIGMRGERLTVPVGHLTNEERDGIRAMADGVYTILLERWGCE